MNNSERPVYAILFEPTKAELESFPFLCIGGVTKESVHPILAHYCDCFNAFRIGMKLAEARGKVERGEPIDEEDQKWLDDLNATNYKNITPPELIGKAMGCLSELKKLRDEGFTLHGKTFSMSELCVGGRFCGTNAN